VGQALRRILVTKVLVPIAVFGVVYALVRVVGPIAGLSPSTADTWAWVAGVAVVLVVFAMGEGTRSAALLGTTTSPSASRDGGPVGISTQRSDGSS